MQPGANITGQDVNAASSQMSHVSISGFVAGQLPVNQTQVNSNHIPGLATALAGHTLLPAGQPPLSTNQITNAGSATVPPVGQISVPIHPTHPVVPSTLNLMPTPTQQQQQQQQQQYQFENVGGMQTNLVSNTTQSPLSPLANNAASFGQNLVQSPLGSPTVILQQQTGSPILSPSTPPAGYNPASSLSLHSPRPYGIQNNIGSYPNAQTTHLQSNDNNNHHGINYSLNQLLPQQQQQQQQLLLLQQKQLQQQQQQQQHLYNQANPRLIHQQQLANQTLNNISFQSLPQGVTGIASIPPPNSNPYISNSLTQMTMSANTAVNTVSADNNPNINTLPHTLPTTLNPSLKKKPVRNVLNSSSSSMSPMSPRNGLFQDSWDIYDDSNTSGVGSSISSPMSPGVGWSEYVIPRYDAPVERDQCLRCNQKVYHMEKVGPVRDVLYHKNCFTCVACGTKLSLKNFHHNPNDMDDYNVFCSSHKPRVVNIASEGNAFYVPKTSPRTQQQVTTHNEIESRDTYVPNVQHRKPVAAEPIIAEVEEEEENIVEVHALPVTDSDQRDGKCDNSTEVTIDKMEPNLNEDETSNVTISQNSQSGLPADSRKSDQSNNNNSSNNKNINNNNSEESPYSSVSSSSSYATSLKNECNGGQDLKPKNGETIDFRASYVRSDRPSSMSSISTTSSTENIKAKVGQRDRISSAEQQETSSIASNSSLERPDRPSAFVQRSVSTTEQPHNKALEELKKSGKMLVKSHSSQEFTHNDLKGVVEPRRLLPRNESMRMDRPSQFH